MKLSTSINFMIVKPDGTPRPYLDMLRGYQSQGYRHLDAVFCGGEKPGSLLMSDGYEALVSAIREEADRLGVSFVQSHLPYCSVMNVAAVSDAHRDEAQSRAIKASGMLGVPWIIAHPATLHGGQGLYTGSKPATMAYFAPFLEEAAKQGAGLAFENQFDLRPGHSPGPGSSFTRVYCAEVSELIDLVDGFADERAGICWDFGHANMTYPESKAEAGAALTQADCLRLIGPRLRATHVHDNDGSTDSHFAPYNGTVNWASCIATLRDIGYGGYFSYEVIPRAFKLSNDLLMSELGHLYRLGMYILGL